MPPASRSRAPASTVAVSELSHVTEEAGVYLAFNRVDRAIEVLEQHIKTSPGTLPAAWMMLLCPAHSSHHVRARTEAKIVHLAR